MRMMKGRRRNNKAAGKDVLIVLGLCLGWKGQRICCVTRGREGGRGGDGMGWEGRGGDGRGGREGEREKGGEGGRGGMTVIHIILMAPYTVYTDQQ